MTDFIKQYWKGKERLWKTFWIWNFLVFNILDILAVLIFFLTLFPIILNLGLQNDPSVSVLYSLGFLELFKVVLGICFIIFFLIYGMWTLVSLWRCAFNCSRKIYGYLARSWVIIQLCFMIAFPILGSIYPESFTDLNDDIIIFETEEYQAGRN